MEAQFNWFSIVVMPCFAPIIWFIVAIAAGIKVIFVDGWFIWATIIGLCLVYYITKGIKWIIELIDYNKHRKENLEKLYNELAKNYQINCPDDTMPITVNIENALSSIIDRYSCDRVIKDKFHSLGSEFFDCFAFENAKVSLGKAPSDLGTVSGKKLKVLSGGWPKVKKVRDAFSLKWRGGAIYCYPYFFIIESFDSITLCDWNSISFSYTNGDPQSHTYLHTRIDGGPDRRYRYNPSIPIYLYSDIIMHVNGEIVNIVVDGENVAENTVRLFRSFQESIKKFGIKLSTDVLNVDLKNDEYASLIRQICEERGTGILKEKLFISILADYKVFDDKYYLRGILKTLKSENLWDEIIVSSPTIDNINTVKQKLLNKNLYSEQQVNEAMAYIGHGLGII